MASTDLSRRITWRRRIASVTVAGFATLLMAPSAGATVSPTDTSSTPPPPSSSSGSGDSTSTSPASPPTAGSDSGTSTSTSPATSSGSTTTVAPTTTTVAPTTTTSTTTSTTTTTAPGASSGTSPTTGPAPTTDPSAPTPTPPPPGPTSSDGSSTSTSPATTNTLPTPSDPAVTGTVINPLAGPSSLGQIYPTQAIVGAGAGFTCTLMLSAAVRCWGGNDRGELGDGNGGPGAGGPQPVFLNANFAAFDLSVGLDHSCIVQSFSNRVRCWGNNFSGQSAPTGTNIVTTPAVVPDIETAVAVAAGTNHSCAVLQGGSVVCWGDNGSGELGNGSTTDSAVPVPVTGITNAVDVTAGLNFTCALLSTGYVKCWGLNFRGQLGNGTTTNSSTPVTVANLTTATALDAGQAHVCAVITTGRIRCWGSGDKGALGNNDDAHHSTPVTVTGITTAATISAGFVASCATLTDGTGKCWGYNTTGQLGNPSAGSASYAPVTVAAPDGFESISIGQSHACGRLINRNLVCWGSNFRGEVGNPLTTDGSSGGTDTTGTTSPVYVRSLDIAPAIATITSPATGITVTKGSVVPTSFTCDLGSAGGSYLEPNVFDEANCRDSNGVSVRGRPVTGAGQLNTSTVGTFTYTVQASGSLGEQATATIQYTVVADTTPPVITVPSFVSREATSPNGANVTFTTSAIDDFDGPVAMSCDKNSGDLFPLPSAALLTTTVTCTATDAANNTSTATFQVQVIDTTAPTLTVPDDFTLEATTGPQLTVTYTVSATDATATTPFVTCTPASGTAFAIGTTVVTCTASDTFANKTTKSFRVTVADTTAPTITVSGGPVSGASYAFGTTPAAPTCTATDTGSGVNASGCTVSGYSTLIGTHTITLTATDLSGNVSTVTIPYTVVATVAGAPVNLAAVPGERSATVSWSAPSFTGGTNLTGYEVTLTGASSVVRTVPASQTSTVFTGLTPGLAYTVSVTALNQAGASSAATGTVTPTAAPTITGTAPNVTAGAVYSFAYAVAGYPAPTVSITGGALPAGLSLSSAGVITGKPTVAGTSTFTVTATSSVGSASVTNTIVVAPAAPASVTIVSGNGQTETATQPFNAPLAVVVRDAYANPVPGVSVRFTVNGLASFAAGTTATATSGSNGVATAPTLTAGSLGGTTTVDATVVGTTLTTRFSERVLWSWEARSDLRVSVAVPTTVSRSGRYTATVTITNGGPNAAASVTASFTPPAGSTVVSATGPTTLVNIGGAFWTIGGIAAGASVTYTVTLTAPAYAITGWPYVYASTQTPDTNMLNNYLLGPAVAVI